MRGLKQQLCLGRAVVVVIYSNEAYGRFLGAEFARLGSWSFAHIHTRRCLRESSKCAFRSRITKRDHRGRPVFENVSVVDGLDCPNCAWRTHGQTALRPLIECAVPLMDTASSRNTPESHRSLRCLNRRCGQHLLGGFHRLDMRMLAVDVVAS